MSLDNIQAVDSIGIDKSTGAAVLTIIDYWDWTEEHVHLVALQAKLNSYFEFIESGQILEAYPEAVGRKLCIEVICRYPISAAGQMLLEKASVVATQLDAVVTSRVHPGDSKG